MAKLCAFFQNEKLTLHMMLPKNTTFKVHLLHYHTGHNLGYILDADAALH